MSRSPYAGAALKRSAWQFLTGKAASAFLTFLILLWLVRLLPLAEYGVYVTLVAGMELAIAIAGVGLPWIAFRYIPDLRINATGRHLRRFVKMLLIGFAALLGIFTVLIWLGLGHYLHWSGLVAYQDAAELYLLVLLVEGLGRQIREPLLGSLMQQGIARLSLVTRLLAFIAFLGVYAYAREVNLLDVIRAELAASILGTIAGLIGLVRHLSVLDNTHVQAGWTTPSLKEMWRTARHMYFAHTLSLFYSPQIFMLAIQRYLGPEQTAIFGFLRSLYDQISRYLPATLFFTLVRPKLIASYVGGGGMPELARNANLAGKLSLFALMPLIAMVFAVGEPVIILLSDAKLPETGLLFFGFILGLIPYSQRQLLETVAVSTGHSNLCLRAAASGILMFPIMLGLLHTGIGLWGPIAALGLGHLLFNLVILMGLIRATEYRPDVTGFNRLMLSMMAGVLCVVWLPSISSAWLNTLVNASLSAGGVLIAAWLIKPFASTERDRINRLIKRRIFIW